MNPPEYQHNLIQIKKKLDKIMTLSLVAVILAVVNIVLSILDRNWAALIGWSAGTLGFLNCYLMALSRRRAQILTGAAHACVKTSRPS